MIPFTIKQKGWFKQSLRGYLPTDWSEVNFSMYNRLKASDGSFMGILEALSFIDRKHWDMLSHVETECNIYPYLKFATEFPVETPCPDFMKIKGKMIQIPKDHGKGTWNQKLNAQKLLVESKDQVAILQELISIYVYPLWSEQKYDEDKAKQFSTFMLDECSMIDLLGLFLHFTEDIFRLMKRDSLHLSAKPTPEQVRAGIDKMSAHKVLNILDPLAHGDVLKYDQLLETEYNLIFHKLNYDHAASKFRERYAEVIKKKVA